MDSFTHIFLGGCLGQIALGKKAGRKAVLWGAIADTVPDFDIFSAFFVHPVDLLLIHRGFTHSILFACLFSLLGAVLLSRLYDKLGIAWKEWAMVLALGSFSHLFIDSLTNYGTGLFEPFSHYRVAFTTIFIADPVFTLPMMIGFIVLVLKRPPLNIKNRFAGVALTLASIYLVWTFVNKSHFESFFRKQFAAQHITIRDQVVAPSPLNNILWGTMGKVDSGYYSGYHSLCSKGDSVLFTFIPNNESMARPWNGQREFELLRRFTKGYSCISVGDDGRPYFNDLRDGVIKGWTQPIGHFTFSYPLVRYSKDTSQLIKANPWPNDGFDGLNSLWDKMWGK
jgi:inner membrane protein